MDRQMKRFLAAIMSVAVVATVAPVVDAQTKQCPVEVSQAQAMLQKVSKAQDIQARVAVRTSRRPGRSPARVRTFKRHGPVRTSRLRALVKTFRLRAPVRT